MDVLGVREAQVVGLAGVDVNLTVKCAPDMRGDLGRWGGDKLGTVRFLGG
jgi:hypothetical protein